MKSQTQRSLLIGFIVSIAACGAVGVYCLLFAGFGYLEARVLGTTAVVAAASILGLSAAIPWERRRWHPVGPLGMVAVSVALVMVLVGIWAERWLFQTGHGQSYFEFMGIACVWGVAFPHIGLMSLARLRRQYTWIRRLTVIAVVTLATLLTLTIVYTTSGDDWMRFMGVVSIVVACGTIATPILHRISAIRVREAIRTFEPALRMTCPRCELSQKLPMGRSSCGGCSLRFLIDIDEETCTTCGYPLYKLTSANCPECGTPIAHRPVTTESQD